MDGVFPLHLLVVLVLAICSHVSEGCDCQESVPQDYFCRSKMAMKIDVTNGGDAWIVSGNSAVPMRRPTQAEMDNHFLYQGQLFRRYRYRIKKMYKGRKPESRYAYTPYHSNLCGGGMELGKNIVIGDLQKFRGKQTFLFTVCNYIRRINELPEAILSKFHKGIYKRHCNCQIDSCQEPGCSEQPGKGKNRCNLNTRGIDRFCYEHTWCQRKKGVCQWLKYCAT